METHGRHAITQGQNPVIETGPRLGFHEGSVDDQRMGAEGGVGLVGAQHPIHQCLAIAATASGHEDVRLIGDLGACLGWPVRRSPAQIAGIAHTIQQRLWQAQSFKRFADLRDPVDPDLVIEAFDGFGGILAGPFDGERLDIVQNIANAQNQPRTARFQRFERPCQFVAETPGLLVHDGNVRGEGTGGCFDNAAAQADHFVDRHREVLRRIAAIGQFHHTRKAHMVDAFSKVEAPGNGGSRNNQRRETGIRFGKCRCNGPGSTQVPQPERVMAVEQRPRLISRSR